MKGGEKHNKREREREKGSPNRIFFWETNALAWSPTFPYRKDKETIFQIGGGKRGLERKGLAHKNSNAESGIESFFFWWGQKVLALPRVEQCTEGLWSSRLFLRSSPVKNSSNRVKSNLRASSVLVLGSTHWSSFCLWFLKIQKLYLFMGQFKTFLDIESSQARIRP